MLPIQNSCIDPSAPFNKALAGFTCVLTITIIALGIVGLTATPSGPFNAIVQFGVRTNGILLGTSIFVFILDLVWIAALCKKTPGQSVSQLEPPQAKPFRSGLLKPESHKSHPSALAPVLERTLPQSRSLWGGLSKLSTDSSALIVPNPEALQGRVLQSTGISNQQPEDVVLEIFKWLSIDELVNIREVSRKYRRLADLKGWGAVDLRKFSPLVTVFDESDWIKHVDLSAHDLSIENVSPLDKYRTIRALKRCLSTLSIKENAGVTLLTIPKGLTLNKLVKLVESQKMRNTIEVYFDDGISNELGDIPVDNTYRIVITNNVLEESQGLCAMQYKDSTNKIGCEMPSVLEATMLLVVKFLWGERSSHFYRLTFTRCSGRSEYSVTGGQIPNGFFIKAFSVCDYLDICGASAVLRDF